MTCPWCTKCTDRVVTMRAELHDCKKEERTARSRATMWCWFFWITAASWLLTTAVWQFNLFGPP